MIQPILDRVLVRRLTKESKSTILIPERYRQAERTGEVLALGPGADQAISGPLTPECRGSGVDVTHVGPDGLDRSRRCTHGVTGQGDDGMAPPSQTFDQGQAT